MDVVVIGSGPGGYAAAFRAADLGKKVLMIEKDGNLGGVCLNRGCIPSKAFLHISKVMTEASHLSTIGVSFSKPQINIDVVRDYKNKIVSKLSNGISQLAKVRKVTTINGEASFLSNNELVVKSESEDRVIFFKKCIIAVGSSSRMLPGLPSDSSSILTSKTDTITLKQKLADFMLKQKAYPF